ncbi:MAG TPA: helix-turn-helix transcriptional regulator [Planctomycetes bacterium]|nr:helix-turn-helix transcriptional regulator [Planctomycetota bacterium]
MTSPLQPKKEDKIENIGPGDTFYGRPKGIVLDEKQWRYVQRRYHISPRELQVIKCVCQGLTNGDIAAKLKVKPGTVKTHLRSIFGKTRVRNKITMLLRCMENAAQFSREANNTAPIPIVDVEKPTPQKPASGEKINKELI